MLTARTLRTAAIAIGIVLVGVLVMIDAAQAASTHVVQPGENLYRIALWHGVTVEAIAQANGLADPARIFPGQVLSIPGAGSRLSTRSVKSGSSTRIILGRGGTRSKIPSEPLGSKSGGNVIVYAVQPGDTLYALARRYGTTVRAIMNANRLRSEFIRVGQPLIIPSLVRSREVLHQVAPAHLPPAPASDPETTPAPAPLPPLTVGAEVRAPRPLRLREGPKMYGGTLALVAADTPLRIIGAESGWYEVELPTGEVGWVYRDDLRPLTRQPAPLQPQPGPRRADIVRDALRYLGTRYVWGGDSRRGVDCSGYIYIVFSSFLADLARMRSFDYFHLGTLVHRAHLQPGDLVFFTTYARGASHVGIYVGERRFIHASSAARQVTITSLDEPYYAARYVGARRLVKP